MQKGLLIFGEIPLAYTVGFFGWCYLAKVPILSKRNARSASMVICSHVSVLLILVMLSQAAFRFYPSFPDWLTEASYGKGSRSSLFEIACIVAVWAIAVLEKRWVYAESGVESPESKEGSS